MWNTLEHSWPTIAAVILGAAHVRRGVTVQIRRHVKQVNKVIDWAISAEPPKDTK